MPTSWKGIQRSFSNHAWSMDVIAVWNIEAQQRLTNTSPNWLQTLQRSIPEAIWEKSQYLAREDTDHITNHVCPSNQKERTSLVRKEAETLTFTSINHGTISSLNRRVPIGNNGHTRTEGA